MNPVIGLFWVAVVPGGSYGIFPARFSGPVLVSRPGRPGDRHSTTGSPATDRAADTPVSPPQRCASI